LFERLFQSWQTAPLPAAFAIAFCFQLTLYLAWGWCMAAGSWILRNKLRAGAVIDERPLKPAQLRRELVRGTLSCLLVGLTTLACIRLAASPVPPTGLRFALEMTGLIVFYEAVFYALHRLLHTGPFRHIHGVHHGSVRMTPWSGLSVHPLEAFFLEAPIVLFALLVPVSVASIVAFQILIQYFSAVGHSNFDPFARLRGMPWMNSLMRMHQLHHARGSVNFSTFSPVLDWIFKTHAA
jgi:lathosterol oxidase